MTVQGKGKFESGKGEMETKGTVHVLSYYSFYKNQTMIFQFKCPFKSKYCNLENEIKVIFTYCSRQNSPLIKCKWKLIKLTLLEYF